MGVRSGLGVLGVAACGLVLPVAVGPTTPAGAAGSVAVATAAELHDAFVDPATSEIVVGADLAGVPGAQRPAGSVAVRVAGGGHTLALGTGASLTSDGPNDVTFDDVVVAGATRSAVEWAGGTVTVTGSTFRDNGAVDSGGYGGAIRALDDTDVVVADSRFQRNAAERGGAISADDGTVTIDGSWLEANRVDDFYGLGGAVLADGGELVATGSTFTGNVAGGGGAFWAHDASLTDSTVSSNQGLSPVNQFGGGGYATVLVLHRSSVVGNRSTFAAGGVYAGRVQVFDSTVSGNHTDDGVGGGILGQTVLLVDSTVAGNSSGSEGGGVAANELRLVHATLTGNAAPIAASVSAAGQATPDRTLRAFASVIGDPEGGGANCGGPSGPLLTARSYGGNVEGGADSCGLDPVVDRVGVADLGLGPLGEAGGPTAVRLPVPGSAVLDRVPAAGCEPDALAGIDLDVPIAFDFEIDVDQRGVARPQGAGCDAGAVELVVPSVDPPTTTPTSTTSPTTTPPADLPAAGARPVRGQATYTG